MDRDDAKHGHDDLAPARGIMVGVPLSLVLWALLWTVLG